MSTPLAEIIRNFTNDELLKKRFSHEDQYSAEAINFMDAEISSRGLSRDMVAEPVEKGHIIEDLAELPGAFSLADAPLVQAILQDAEIPFITRNAANTATFPIESMSETLIGFWVPQSRLADATAEVHEHFEVQESGTYARRCTSTRDALMAFSFGDVQMTPKEADEIIDAQFTAEEAAGIIMLLAKLRAEVDTVEERIGHFILMFDNLDHCEKMLKMNDKGYSRTDFLTILEVLQVWRDDECYTETLDSVAAGLTDFFLG